MAAAASSPGAAVTFTAKTVDPRGAANIWGKGAGDLNNDGRIDVLAGSNSGGLFWYQNPSWTKRTISSGARIEEDMEVADLDRDGRRDVVAVAAGGLTWFRNSGTGWSAQALVTGLNVHDVEVADLDGDGKLDLIGRNQGSSGNVLYFWRQSSTTSWSRSTVSLPEAGEGLLAVDLDRDAKKDIVIGKYWFKNTSSSGRLSFVRYTYNSAAAASAFIAAGRIDGDTLIDLVVSPAEPRGGRGNIAWFRAPSSATGGWSQQIIESNVESVHHFVGVADFDRDGTNDVVSAMTQYGNNPKIKIFYNVGGAGRFGAPTIIANTSSHSMKIIDVDNDGYKSLYGADYADTPSTKIDLWQSSR